MRCCSVFPKCVNLATTNIPADLFNHLSCRVAARQQVSSQIDLLLYIKCTVMIQHISFKEMGRCVFHMILLLASTTRFRGHSFSSSPKLDIKHPEAIIKVIQQDVLSWQRRVNTDQRALLLREILRSTSQIRVKSQQHRMLPEESRSEKCNKIRLPGCQFCKM